MANLNPEVLEWAVRRSGLSHKQILKAFPKYPCWLDGSWKPTVKQLRDFAGKTHISVSELFANSLPDYALQITDFRTVDDAPAQDPSPELFDTIDAMLSRQDWMRGYFLHEGFAPIDFVGSYTNAPLTDDVRSRIVEDLHALLKLDHDWAASCKGVADALKDLKNSIEASGISVVINGVVNDNTHRVLDVSEFRGFVLSDRIAPIIFINGRDTKSAQIFTLVHELCHLAFFQTGVSNAADDEETDIVMERFCNSVAADFLVPAGIIADQWEEYSSDPYSKVQAIARTCKVNFVVVARKAKDTGLITEGTYFTLYRQYKSEVPVEVKSGKSGGNYFYNKQYKLGAVFSDAIRTAVRSDYLSYRDAYDLTGMSAPSFKQYFEKVA
jgi:Zn-dependent peptidase ImmA (M78 family)